MAMVRIQYITKKTVIKVDESVFQNNLKEDLIKKYGKPDTEYVISSKKTSNYTYCWGRNCSAVKGRASAIGHTNLDRFPEGKYLIVRFDYKKAGLSYVLFDLFDNSPLFRWKEAREGKARERAKEKINF